MPPPDLTAPSRLPSPPRRPPVLPELRIPRDLGYRLHTRLLLLFATAITGGCKQGRGGRVGVEIGVGEIQFSGPVRFPSHPGRRAFRPPSPEARRTRPRCSPSSGVLSGGGAPSPCVRPAFAPLAGVAAAFRGRERAPRTRTGGHGSPETCSLSPPAPKIARAFSVHPSSSLGLDQRLGMFGPGQAKKKRVLSHFRRVRGGPNAPGRLEPRCQTRWTAPPAKESPGGALWLQRLSESGASTDSENKAA